MTPNEIATDVASLNTPGEANPFWGKIRTYCFHGSYGMIQDDETWGD